MKTQYAPPPAFPTRREFLKSAALAGSAATLASTVSRAAEPSTHDGREITSLTDHLRTAPVTSSPSPEPLAPPDKQPAGLEIPTPKRKAGWAVVGLGELALGEVLPAIRSCENTRLVALVSGHPEKARKVADAYQVKHDAVYTYEDFDRIRDNPEIDVVYIALPNSMHAEYSIRASQAGKHVLCEKPMAVTIAECEQMIRAAKTAGKLLGMAYRLQHEPMNRAVMEMCRERKFGGLKLFSSEHCQNVRAPNIRLSAALGGGAVGDLGVYSINAGRYITSEEPVEATASAYWGNNDARFREVPESVAYLLRYPSGVLATCSCSFGTATSSRYRVLFEKGFIEMDPAFAYRGLRLKISEKSSWEGTPKVGEILFEPVNQFARQFDDFSRRTFSGQQPASPGEEGLADIKIILAIHESIRTGQPVKISTATSNP